MSDTLTRKEQFTLSFYVTPLSLQVCKEAIFRAGAGSYPGGRYTRTCFVTRGIGQFLPNEGASPNIGSVGKVETLEEMKVESICVGRDVMVRAVAELKKAHPYEEVSCLQRRFALSCFSDQLGRISGFQDGNSLSVHLVSVLLRFLSSDVKWGLMQ